MGMFPNFNFQSVNRMTRSSGYDGMFLIVLKQIKCGDFSWSILLNQCSAVLNNYRPITLLNDYLTDKKQYYDYKRNLLVGPLNVLLIPM